MRILQISPELDGGGVDRLLYDYSIRMQDQADIDFVVTSKTEGILERPLLECGFKIYHVPQMRADLAGHKKRLHDIISNNNYDIIHDHRGYRAYFALSIADNEGIPVRIAHSHIASIPETPMQRVVRVLSTSLVKQHATNLFACGRMAASWMWGRRALDNNDVRIMTNAIDTSKFAFNSKMRQEVRDELSLGDGLVVGNVARFADQKNHKYLIEIFNEIQKMDPSAKLVLAGHGEREDEIRSGVNDLGILEKVLFLGVRDDVSRLLNAMDVFLMPSLYEGLPVTVVEAQANGLPVIASSTITDEVFFEGPSKQLDLGLPAREWARKTMEVGGSRRKNGAFPVSSTLLEEYGINQAAARQLAWYKDAVKKRGY